MAKQPMTQVDKAKQELEVMPDLKPAEVQGVNSKIELDKTQLPVEFQGKTELVETGFAPTVKWERLGEYAAGIFVGFEEDAGPNHSRVYQFETKDGRPFGVWGTTVLDRAFDKALSAGIIKAGYMVLIVFVSEMNVGQPSPLKMFQIQVAQK